MLWKRAKALGVVQQGLAAVEMVLIFPTIVIFIFLTMDVGLFFYDYVSASNALREGARCGTVGYDDASVEARVIETSGFSAPVSVTIDRTAGKIGSDIVVTGTFDHEWMLPTEIFAVPSQFTRSVTMRLEDDTFTRTNCGSAV